MTQSKASDRPSPAAYNPDNYQRPSVAVDVVVFALHSQSLNVLLVRRKRWPHAGAWALPGGFVRLAEALEAAARRELREETGLADLRLEQLHTFGDPGRDPRTRVISVAYLALVGAGQLPAVRGGDDAAAARWWPMHDLPPLAFDHDRILAHARRRLRCKLEHTALGATLLPETFTLGELHAAYEAVLGEKLDKRSLSRKLLAAGVLEEAGRRSGNSRPSPARLYRFTIAAVERENLSALTGDWPA